MIAVLGLDRGSQPQAVHVVVHGDSPYASPLNAADHGGLPAALMITAEFCPLRDEGEAYANALSLANVPVEYHRYADLPHGFISMASVLDTVREALDEIVGFLRDRLGRDFAAVSSGEGGTLRRSVSDPLAAG